MFTALSLDRNVTRQIVILCRLLNSSITTGSRSASKVGSQKGHRPQSRNGSRPQSGHGSRPLSRESSEGQLQDGKRSRSHGSAITGNKGVYQHSGHGSSSHSPPHRSSSTGATYGSGHGGSPNHQQHSNQQQYCSGGSMHHGQGSGYMYGRGGHHGDHSGHGGGGSGAASQVGSAYSGGNVSSGGSVTPNSSSNEQPPDLVNSALNSSHPPSGPISQEQLSQLAVPAADSGIPSLSSGQNSAQFPGMALDVSMKRDLKEGKNLGTGQYGRVFLAKHNETGCLIAVKEMILPPPPDIDDEDAVEADNHALKPLETEIALLKTLSHPHIVTYIGHEVLSTEDHAPKVPIPARLFIFLEYLGGGSVKQQLQAFGSFDEVLVQKYTHQLFTGMEYLHKNGVIHRDLKTRNLLLKQDGTLKIADFGCSKQLSDLFNKQDASHSKIFIVGTIHYMSPEIFEY